MARKGAIEEILSKARFVDEPKDYKIIYRDFENLVEKTLPEFIRESDNFQTIPVTRIEQIMKKNTILFKKAKEDGE